MDVLLNVPDDIVHKLRERWTDLPAHALQTLAAEAYQAGVLTAAEVQRMLGLSSRWETDAVLKHAGAYLHYSEEDLQQDVENLRRLSSR
jgi:predicted HTH domain antitoxin